METNVFGEDMQGQDDLEQLAVWREKMDQVAAGYNLGINWHVSHCFHLVVLQMWNKACTSLLTGTSAQGCVSY